MKLELCLISNGKNRTTLTEEVRVHMHHTLQQLQEYVSELEQVVVHLATQEISSGCVVIQKHRFC